MAASRAHGRLVAPSTSTPSMSFPTPTTPVGQPSAQHSYCTRQHTASGAPIPPTHWKASSTYVLSRSCHVAAFSTLLRDSPLHTCLPTHTASQHPGLTREIHTPLKWKWLATAVPSYPKSQGTLFLLSLLLVAPCGIRIHLDTSTDMPTMCKHTL